MPRTALWTSIAATLRAEIAEGSYRPGDRLPTEAALSSRFGVNRHTVRHALSVLSDEGLVQSRRGSGVFVSGRPMDYALGRRVRFHQNVEAAGRTPSRRLTRLETRPANAREAQALRITEGDPVHIIEGTSFADDEPLAAYRSVYPATRFPDLLSKIETHNSATAALAACGLADYIRAETRLTAKTATPVLANALRIAPGAPVLRTVSINVDAQGMPVEHGTTWFAGDRVTLTVDRRQG